MKIKYFLMTAVLVTAVLFSSGVVKAQTADNSALIQSIKAQIAALQAMLSQLTQLSQGTLCYDFNTNLKMGDTGQDVINLKSVLYRNGLWPSAEYPGDSYDEQTASYVSAFQEKYASNILTPRGLAHGTGYVGVSTRAKLNSLYGCSTAPTTNSPLTTQPPTAVNPPVSTVPGSPSLTITSPNGGETLTPGQVVTISWTAANLPSGTMFGIGLKNDQNGQIFPISSGRVSGTSLSWTVPQLTSITGDGSSSQNKLKVRLTEYDSNYNNLIDDSNNYFTIAFTNSNQPAIAVTYPNGGETFTPGQVVTITWTATNLPAGAQFGLGLVNDANGQQFPISSGRVSGTSLSWTVPQLTSITGDGSSSQNKLKVRLTEYDSNYNNLIDDSNNYFTIAYTSVNKPSIAVTITSVSPNPITSALSSTTQSLTINGSGFQCFTNTPGFTCVPNDTRPGYVYGTSYGLLVADSNGNELSGVSVTWVSSTKVTAQIPGISTPGNYMVYLSQNGQVVSNKVGLTVAN